MLYNKLIRIRQELDSMFSNKNLFNEGVQVKLDRIESNYNKLVELNCDYILSRSNYKVFKAMERFRKNKENKDGEETNWGFIEII